MKDAPEKPDGSGNRTEAKLKKERKNMKELEGRRVVLASASPRRKELLLQAGIHAEILPSHKEERTRAKTPAALVKALSAGKAADIAAGQPAGTVVIGADTVVVRDGAVLGKPKDADDAVRMLKSLAGRTHHVYTGVTLILCGKRKITFYERTEVSVFPMTEDEIRAYVESGDPMDKAGAYGIQGPFGAYVRGIRGDYTSVVGLPLGRTVWELKELLKEE